MCLRPVCYAFEAHIKHSLSVVIYKYKCNALKMTSEICVTMMMNKVLIFFKLVFNWAEKFRDIFFKRYEVAYSEL